MLYVEGKRKHFFQKNGSRRIKSDHDVKSTSDEKKSIADKMEILKEKKIGRFHKKAREPDSITFDGPRTNSFRMEYHLLQHRNKFIKLISLKIFIYSIL